MEIELKRDVLFDKHPFMYLAYREALKSTYKQRIGCLLVKSGSIILSRGYNQLRYNRLGSRFSAWNESTHAEVDCLTKIHKDKIKGSILYIYRAGADDEPMLSMPCENCYAMCEWVGIKKIIFSKSEYPYHEEIKI